MSGPGTRRVRFRCKSKPETTPGRPPKHIETNEDASQCPILRCRVFSSGGAGYRKRHHARIGFDMSGAGLAKFAHCHVGTAVVGT
jgi:hypothetical protein